MTNQHPPFNIEQLSVDNQLIAIAIEGEAGKDFMESDYIRVHSLEGNEGVSQPFQLTVELRADDTIEAGLLLDSQVIGRWARVKVAMPVPGSFIGATKGKVSANPFTPRYFRGVITELAVGDAGVYTLTLNSPLHLLTLRNDYYIFSRCDIKQLICNILSQELMLPCFKLRFDFSDSPTLTRIQDWMQAGESSMDLLQRVLAKAFIHYFFIHEESTLTLVFSDKPMTTDTVSIPGYQAGPLPLRYTFSSVEPLKASEYDVFASLRYSVKMMPPKVKTLLCQVDPQWKDNTVASFHPFLAQDGQASRVSYQHYWNYDYGVNDAEAKDQLTKICQQINTEAATLSGTVHTPLLSPGYCFKLHNPLLKLPPEEVKGTGRPEFDERVFVVTKIQHKISIETGYSGSVEATEVNQVSDEQEQTFLTPFSMQATQQGSVIAKVLDHEMPVGWRYRSKNNFQPEKGQVYFEGEMQHQGECYGESGCLVELMTGQRHWVVLPRTSQSVPEINSMVMIGRGSNESEQPELQQVLASHGSKVIQPPDRRSASWQANTNWGSSYSTSYGDSISIHFGHQAQTSLDQAIRLVEGAYDNVGMAGTDYSSCSYNKAGSWSVALSSNQSSPDVGVLSASISQGSSFNESHSAHSYGYSATNVSEGYSETGKSANVSIIGQYTPAPDLGSPSFVNGKLPMDIGEYTNALGNGDTFSRSSILGRTISCNGVGTMAPDVSIPSITPLSHYSSSITIGKSENYSKTIGETYNDSLMVGKSTSISVNCSDQESRSLTIGDISNTDTRIASVTNVSTTIGTNDSFSTQVADNFSQATTIGNNTGIQTTISNNINLSTTIGTTSDTSTFIGAKNSNSTFIGKTHDVSYNNADRTSVSTVKGVSRDTSVNMGERHTHQTVMGSSTEYSLNLSAKKSTQIAIGLSDETSIRMAASNSTSLSLAASTNFGLSVGLSTSLTFNAAASMSMENTVGASLTMKNSISASVDLINTLSATATIVNQAGPEVKLTNGLTQAEMDLRPQVRTRGTIIETIVGVDVKL